jgi:hypothetical protein
MQPSSPSPLACSDCIRRTAPIIRGECAVSIPYSGGTGQRSYKESRLASVHRYISAVMRVILACGQLTATVLFSENRGLYTVRP